MIYLVALAVWIVGFIVQVGYFRQLWASEDVSIRGAIGWGFVLFVGGWFALCMTTAMVVDVACVAWEYFSGN